MIKTGICSVTLAQCSPQELVETVQQAQLQGIEWWGKGHVPHGDLITAAQVRQLTINAGLEVSSYGSYYRVGVSEGDGLSFASVLDTAEALGAPTIRVWAGNIGYRQADQSYRDRVLEDTFRIASCASKKNISISFEFHGGTFTDTNESALCFASCVQHPNVFFSWQSPHGYPLEYCEQGLKGLLARLSTIHVYHWTTGSYENNTVNETIRPIQFSDFFRHPLEDGRDRWQNYLGLAAKTNRDHFALLEFVKGDSPEQVIADAQILRSIIAGTL